MEWIGALHDRTNWCRLGVTWKQREVSIASLKGLVQVSMPTSVTEMTNALSPGQYEDLSTNLPTRDDLRFGEVDPEDRPVGQETRAPPLLYHCYPLVSLSIIRYKTLPLDCRLDQTLFLNLFVVILMYQLTNLLWHLVRCRFLHVI